MRGYGVLVKQIVSHKEKVLEFTWKTLQTEKKGRKESYIEVKGRSSRKGDKYI